MKSPKIIFSRYTSYTAVDVDIVVNYNGKKYKTSKVTSLCRCGKSKNKPFCDGEHNKEGLNEIKKEDRILDKTKDYIGKDIIIHYNRGVCSHFGACVNELRSVFNPKNRPWINADGASLKDIIETIEKCPSGALSYTIGSKRYQDLNSEPMILLEKNGPLHIRGAIELIDNDNSTPECTEHYTLCRCGKSKNKPFCDGTHRDVSFKSE